jgi:hypothetical protein
MRIVVDIQQDQLPLDGLTTSTERHDRGLSKGGGLERIGGYRLYVSRAEGCARGAVVIVVRLSSSGVVVAVVDALRLGRVVLSLEPGGLDEDVTKLLVTCRAGCGATVPGA